MTATEILALEDRLAKALTAAGIRDVWDPTEQCPQGHRNHIRERGRLVPIGGLCPRCVTEEYWLQSQELQDQYLENPAWHPEWRIGRHPKPLVRSWEVLLQYLVGWTRERGFGWWVQQFYDPWDRYEALIYAGPQQDWKARGGHAQ